MTKDNKKNKNIDFNEAFKKIEKINQWFEKQDLDLEQALLKYETAMDLVKKCKQRLKKTENKFEEIKEKFEKSENEN